MLARKSLLLAVVATLGLTQLAGCPVGDPRTGNQGGGSVISAALKLANGTLTSLTPDEIQLVTDLVSDLNPDIDVVINDDQAEAAVDFLVANNVNSIEDIQALIAQAENDPNSLTIPASIEALIEAGNLPEVQLAREQVAQQQS